MHDLHSNLISLPHYPMGQSLQYLTNKLRHELDALHRIEKQETWYELLSDIYHQAILLMSMAGYQQWARDLSYTQIQLFIAWGYHDLKSHLLKQVFQPWLDLIDIDIQQRHLFDAFDKLNIMLKQHRFIIKDENIRLRNRLHYALHTDLHLSRHVLRQGMCRRIQLHLILQQYSELIHYLEHDPIPTLFSLDSVVMEARFIAYVNSGQQSRVNSLLGSIQNYSDDIIHILRLRECEWMIMQDHQQANDHLRELTQSFSKRLMEGHVRIVDVVYALHAASLLEKIEDRLGALDTIENAYLAAQKIVHQPLQAECLVKIYGLTLSGHQKEKIENRMITLYFESCYDSVRKLLLNCNPDLRFVECRAHEETLFHLYDDLWALAA